ncbi:MAG: hypothetical protein NC205_02925 [Prevotella sp.]|nr:hypothetical protein [Alistipes senegalensis]MCM1357520.1 hypothetical protein [Prevotella sp.]MCM1472467.1 hypothetical protein [Muribaculaceae bacterium]
MDFSGYVESFLLKLRIDDFFDTTDYTKIREILLDKVPEWKKSRSVPVEYFIEIIILIDQLAGGSRFFDEETAIKVEDSCLEIEDILNNLI